MTDWRVNRSKEKCPRGHNYDDANTEIDYRGWRRCKACRKEADARYRRERRLARDGAA